MLAAGVDIGGTSIKVALVGGDGSLSQVTSIPTRPQDKPATTIGRITAVLSELLDRGDVSPGAPVGVGCAGLISREEGIVRVSPNLPNWKDVPLGESLARSLDRSVWVTNDANAFVLGEGRLGAGRGARILLGLTLGTGVGGGILIDGSLFTGAHGGAGEMGHTPVDVDGLPCSCGSRGCLETFVGNRFIVMRYMELAAREPTPEVQRRLGPAPGEPTPEILYEAAQAGDEMARETFRMTGFYLGVGLAGLVNTLDPDQVVIGGGVAQAGDLILEPARLTLAERAMLPPDRLPKVLQGALGPHAAVIGAALLALERSARASPG